jgi:hypothetical protein
MSRFSLDASAPLAGCSGLFGSRSGCYIARMTFMVEIEREDDGRWLADVPDLPLPQRGDAAAAS